MAKTREELEAEKRRAKVASPGLSRLTRTLQAASKDKVQVAQGKKNRKGVQTPSEKEAERVRHRLELKYPKTYPGGGRKKR